jgi:hypothetical protein
MIPVKVLQSSLINHISIQPPLFLHVYSYFNLNSITCLENVELKSKFSGNQLKEYMAS